MTVVPSGSLGRIETGSPVASGCAATLASNTGAVRFSGSTIMAAIPAKAMNSTAMAMPPIHTLRRREARLSSKKAAVSASVSPVSTPCPSLLSMLCKSDIVCLVRQSPDGAKR